MVNGLKQRGDAAAVISFVRVRIRREPRGRAHVLRNSHAVERSSRISIHSDDMNFRHHIVRTVSIDMPDRFDLVSPMPVLNPLVNFLCIFPDSA